MTPEAMGKQRWTMQALEDENRALVEALRKYGQHDQGCARFAVPGQVGDCDCGYLAALQSASPTKGTEERGAAGPSGLSPDDTSAKPNATRWAPMG